MGTPRVGVGRRVPFPIHYLPKITENTSLGQNTFFQPKYTPSGCLQRESFPERDVVFTTVRQDCTMLNTTRAPSDLVGGTFIIE